MKLQGLQELRIKEENLVRQHQAERKKLEWDSSIKRSELNMIQDEAYSAKKRADRVKKGGKAVIASIEEQITERTAVLRRVEAAIERLDDEIMKKDLQKKEYGDTEKKVSQAKKKLEKIQDQIEDDKKTLQEIKQEHAKKMREIDDAQRVLKSREENVKNREIQVQFQQEQSEKTQFAIDQRSKRLDERENALKNMISDVEAQKKFLNIA